MAHSMPLVRAFTTSVQSPGPPRFAAEPSQRAEAARRLAAGESVSAVARALGTSRQTVTRVRDAAAEAGGAPQRGPAA